MGVFQIIGLVVILESSIAVLSASRTQLSLLLTSDSGKPKLVLGTGSSCLVGRLMR